MKKLAHIKIYSTFRCYRNRWRTLYVLPSFPLPPSSSYFLLCYVNMYYSIELVDLRFLHLLQ